MRSHALGTIAWQLGDLDEVPALLQVTGSPRRSLVPTTEQGTSRREGRRAHLRVDDGMSNPFGGSIPDEIVLSRQEAATVLFALDEAVEAATVDERRHRLEQAAQIIVEKLLPDLPDL